MSLELLGSRILAPYFGNSIFVWGALIAVFLTALALGYYVGGMLADMIPKVIFLCFILMASGMMVLILPSVYPAVNNWIFALDFGYKWNPLLASTVLFLLPGMGMGIVSPFVIKLKAHSIQSIGNIAGRLYAASTAGSIIGTLGTAFFLIPAYGTKTNIRILAAVLIFTGALLLPKIRKSSN